MYYILKDFQENHCRKWRRLKLGQNEVVVTNNALYGQKNVYILPKNNGRQTIAGREFFRSDRGILVKKHESY